MSRAKLAAAKELIEAGQHDAARAVLKTMPGDETAKAWLKKLPRKRRGWWKVVAVAFVFFAGVGIGSSGTRSMLQGERARQQGADAVQTQVVSRIDATSTPLPAETRRPAVTPITNPTATETPAQDVTPTETPRSLLDRLLGRGGPTEVPSITPILPTETPGRTITPTPTANTGGTQAAADRGTAMAELAVTAAAANTGLTQTALAPPPPAIIDETAYTIAVMDHVAIWAGGRNVQTVRAVNGRPNGGEVVVIVSYLTTESTEVGIVDEWIDLFEAIAGAISANNLDVDSVMLVPGEATGIGAGMLTTSVQDLMDFYGGRINRATFLSRLHVVVM